MFKTGKLIFENGRRQIIWNTERYPSHADASKAIAARTKPLQKTKR